MAAPRDLETRKSDSLAMLATPAMDVWVATAAPSGEAHLVPLSLAWVEERVVLAVESSSPTARNLAASGAARLGLGQTRDVVMIDAALERTVGVDDDASLGTAYVGQADWDPRGLAGYLFLVLKPVRIQAWRESNEIPGRTLLRDGAWLV